jgi:predicted acylesterase/phospholipase RssA
MTVEPTAESQAKAILAGKTATADEISQLVDKLHRERRFGLARKLLDRLSHFSEVTVDPKLRLRVGQKLALSTYKDPDLPLEGRLKSALGILQTVDDLAQTVDQETLGLAGAIYKRLWEYHGSERELDIAYGYYLRGYERGVERDYGYTAINAAFVLDLLADLENPDENRPVGNASISTTRKRQAQDIRQKIADQLPPLLSLPHNAWLQETWWFFVTIGEAFFGLGKFDDARQWLQRATALSNVPDWERESTARQLAKLMTLMEREATRRGASLDSRARKVLSEFLGNSEPALLSIVRGKVGLALSGGGFRASLYHVGVLARLAELDLLRHVECLSCVSGGSIVGAHYYLELRKLLSSKGDSEITREDYIEIVERLGRDLLAGIQRNIRVRVAAEWWTNIKMMLAPDYSRTLRAGELYEKEIFSRVRDGQGDRPRWLNDLKIASLGERNDFRPKDHNWQRAAKVPILILNATSLNTGHNWQFTASWMGEPPAGIDINVDANYRLRRLYYEDAPPPHNRMRLGYAVAASACVPGIFEPLPIVDLYERVPPEGDRKIRPIVRLVDGGVHDNQGISALLEQDCSVLLVSDASGQMDHIDFPSAGLLGVPLRANSILQSRVRASQYEDLASRRRSGTLKGLMYVHLKKDLETQPVDWVGCQDPSDPLRPRVLTSYGIQKGIQRRLAAIRTDLDSFSDVEASALMTSGYLATETALKEPILGFEIDPSPRARWEFLKIEPLLRQSTARTPLALWLDSQLRIGSKLAFKVWLLMRYLQFAAGLGVGIVVAAIVIAIITVWQKLNEEVFRFSVTYADVMWGVALSLLLICCFALIAKLVNYRKPVREILLGFVMATVGFILARLHLHIFDPLFLRQGRLPLVFAETQTAVVRERARGEEERERSLKMGPKSEGRLTYAVQQSEAFVLSAKRGLDPSTEAKVMEAIFRLSDDPHLPDSHADPNTNLQLLRVTGTPWRIAYDTDENERRVRIHYLAREDEFGGAKA